MRLLVTRPEPDGARTAALLRGRGHHVLVAPLLRIETLPAPFGRAYRALAVTSANAIRAIAAHPQCDELARLPLFAVGTHSAEAARAAGFAAVEDAGGDGAALVRLIAARLGGSGARLLYPAGENRAVDLAAALAPHGVTVETVAVYRAVPAGTFPEAVRVALESGSLDGVLHYSARSAAAFAAAVETATLREAAAAVTHYCLSAAVARPLAAIGAKDLKIAVRPDESALFALLSAR